MNHWHDKVQRFKDQQYNEDYNKWVETLHTNHCKWCNEDVSESLNHVWTKYPTEDAWMCNECAKMYLEDKV